MPRKKSTLPSLPNEMIEGVFVPRDTVTKLENLSGCLIGSSPERLALAAARMRLISVEGTEIILESDLLERIRTRASAGRETSREYLSREIVRLLRSEVGI